ncbi:MAG: MBL fold metallo-hydrolase, partial [Alphaproteobacteria bacterium]|nr:MBL fold metallo-hydrolase [Alphaproteobacteria bacterium]
TEVAARLSWVRLPLPFALNHINCWIFGAPEDCAIIDAGHYDARTKSIWQPLIARRRVEQTVVTHYHPDHLGCAAWIQEQTGASVLISADEYRVAQESRAMSDADEAQYRLEFFRRHGLGGKALDDQAGLSFGYGISVPELPEQPQWLVDGQKLMLGGESWQVITGGGHSSDQTMLYDSGRNILLAADQVLPAISPNISVWFDLPDADPLDEYFASLARLRGEIPFDALVLPSHGRPFRGLHGRIDQLAAHHRERLAMLLRLLTRPHTAAECLTPLFERELDSFQMSFAMGEALAHLNYLVARGRVTRSEHGGVIHFVTVS